VSNTAFQRRFREIETGFLVEADVETALPLHEVRPVLALGQVGIVDLET
jgi:hypothetical protein